MSKQAGINRLSIGVQSFNDEHLKTLGRIHNSTQSKKAIEIAQTADFEKINVDLMYGLPRQTTEAVLSDLNQVLFFGLSHVSWYQLTLEPNTVFYKYPPKSLPKQDDLALMEQAAYPLLKSAGLKRYEISAFAKEGNACQHNLNYWTFGDYIGIGAGAHEKLSFPDGRIIRRTRHRQPETYLTSDTFIVKERILSTEDKCFEFMLNHLRLVKSFTLEQFEIATGVSADRVLPGIEQAKEADLLIQEDDRIRPSEKGYLFLNDLIQIFLTEPE